MIQQVSELTAVSLGSFGEFIYKVQILEQTKFKIYKGHQDRFDFHVNDELVDVKATKKHLTKKTIPLKPYTGKRVPERIYAQVEFFSDAVRISHEKKEMFILSWDEIGVLWDRWKKNDAQKLTFKGKSPSKENAKIIKSKIADYFSKQGIDTRIIYRTVQAGFGKESPANLKPNEIKPNRITVFLNFNDHNVSEDNFHSIIAFTDSDSQSLPMRPKTNLGVPKVDIPAMDNRYTFEDLSDLYNNFSRLK